MPTRARSSAPVRICPDWSQARHGPWRRPPDCAGCTTRLRVADAYGLDRGNRAELITALDDAIDRIEAAVRRSVDAGDRSSIAIVNRTGGLEKFDRRLRWWTDHHEQFAAMFV